MSDTKSADTTAPNSDENWKVFILECLEDAFDRKKEKNPSYSLRAFARDLKMSPGALSDLRKGRRSISPTKALVLATNMDMPQEDLALLKQALKQEIEDHAHLALHVLCQSVGFDSGWKCSLLLAALELRTPPRTPADLANYLSLSLPETEAALQLLVSKEWVINENGSFKLARRRPLGALRFDPKNPDSRNAALASLNEAQNAVSNQSIAEGEFSSWVFGGSSQTLQEIRRRLNKIQADLSIGIKSSEKEKILRMNIQIWPVHVEENTSE